MRTYHSPITPNGFLLPKEVRDGVLLRATLLSEEQYLSLRPDRLFARLDVARRRNGDYRFTITAEQPEISCLWHECMSEEYLNAKLKWREIDAQPTIDAVLKLVRRELRRYGQTPRPSRTPTVPTTTLDDVYRQHGDFRYRVFPHTILKPVIETLHDHSTPAHRLEDRVQYAPQSDPYDMQLSAHLDLTAEEARLPIAVIVQAIASDCDIPFARVNISYKPIV